MFNTVGASLSRPQVNCDITHGFYANAVNWLRFSAVFFPPAVLVSLSAVTAPATVDNSAAISLTLA